MAVIQVHVGVGTSAGCPETSSIHLYCLNTGFLNELGTRLADHCLGLPNPSTPRKCWHVLHSQPCLAFLYRYGRFKPSQHAVIMCSGSPGLLIKGNVYLLLFALFLKTVIVKVLQANLKGINYICSNSFNFCLGVTCEHDVKINYFIQRHYVQDTNNIHALLRKLSFYLNVLMLT